MGMTTDDLEEGVKVSEPGHLTVLYKNIKEIDSFWLIRDTVEGVGGYTAFSCEDTIGYCLFPMLAATCTCVCLGSCCHEDPVHFLSFVSGYDNSTCMLHFVDLRRSILSGVSRFCVG